jgi:hypothetical protein
LFTFSKANDTGSLLILCRTALRCLGARVFTPQ